MAGSINGLTGGHDISAAFANMPAVKPHITPEQAFQDHLSDQYGIQAQNYNPGTLALHAENFATHHGGGHDDVIKQLTDLVAALRAEIAEMKQGHAGHAHAHGKPEHPHAHGGPGHGAAAAGSPIAHEVKLANEKAEKDKDDAKVEYESYIAKKVAMKIAKKAADDILEMWN